MYFPDIASELWIKYTCIYIKTFYVRLASQEIDKLGFLFCLYLEGPNLATIRPFR